MIMKKMMVHTNTRFIYFLRDEVGKEILLLEESTGQNTMQQKRDESGSLLIYEVRTVFHYLHFVVDLSVGWHKKHMLERS